MIKFEETRGPKVLTDPHQKKYVISTGRDKKHSYYFQFNHEFQHVLKLLDFDVTSIKSYEVLCYQKGKLNYLEEEIHEKVSYFEEFNRERASDYRHYLHDLLTIVKRKSRRIQELEFEIYGGIEKAAKWDALEKDLIEKNQRAENLRDETREVIDKTQRKLNSLTD